MISDHTEEERPRGEGLTVGGGLYVGLPGACIVTHAENPCKELILIICKH